MYVFCGEQLLLAYLRPAKKDAALHAAAILKLLVTRLRQAWPGVRIIFRGDSGFCRPLLLAWCERHHVHYVVGMAKNSRLLANAEWWREQACPGLRLHPTTATHLRRISLPRRQLAVSPLADRQSRAQRSRRQSPLGGHQSRDTPQALYEDMYCARGEMENRIKECQLGLFADRTSCHLSWPNQFRLLLASLAHLLLERLRTIGLAGTELARAQVWILRGRLLKVGAVIVRNTRRLRFFLASAFPHQETFLLAAQRFASG